MTAQGTRGIGILVLVMLIVACCTPPNTPTSPAAPLKPKPVAGPYLRGVNNATFGWFEGYNEQAGNESAASYAFEASHGVSVVRLPIVWERIQPTLGGSLAPDEV